MFTNALLTRLGIEHPITLAPMGGGPSTPELVAAVSNAGGLGSIGAAYLTPEQIVEAVQRTRELTQRPFSINLFSGAWDANASGNAAPMLSLLKDIHERLGIPEPTLPSLPPDPFPAQFETVLSSRPAAFSFTFGTLTNDQMKRLHRQGIVVFGTATTVEEARVLAALGVDAIIGQGAEAGAHRGTFLAPFEQSMVPTLELVRGIVSETSTPVIGAGGLMDGRDIATVLAAGASAVALGTAFLSCPESGASSAYKQAILSAAHESTVITRAFSGRPARGLKNAFIRSLEDRQEIILPYPLQNALTRPMRTAAAKRGAGDFLSLWAGTGVARARSMPAAELVRTLLAELATAQDDHNIAAD